MALSLTALTPGCSGADDTLVPLENVSKSSERLYVDTATIWPSNNISVCWEDTGWDTQKAWVRSAVAATWQQSSAVRFTGWGDCTSAGANIRIKVNSVANGPATLGYGSQLNNVLHGMTLDFTFSNFFYSTCSPAKEACIRSMAAHEFGHALGFVHEQDRPDKPSSCAATADPNTSGFTKVGSWDVMSIMNYCRPDRVLGGNSLSETDKVGLQNYYGRPNYFADMTGDGFPDALLVNRDGIHVKSATPYSVFDPNTYNVTTTPFFGNLGTYFADVTGDGKADAIAVNTTGIQVRRSTGSFFNGAETWSSTPYYGTLGTFFADVTGDGKADVIEAVDWAHINVRASTGSAFGPSTAWIPTSTGLPLYLALLMGDVTGDKKADLVVVARTGVMVYVSTGTSFRTPLVTFASGATAGQRGTFLADVTGDHIDDLVSVNDDGIYVRPSIGKAFPQVAKWTSDAYYGDRSTHFGHVINGGYQLDAIAVNDDGITSRRSNTAAFDPSLNRMCTAYYGSR